MTRRLTVQAEVRNGTRPGKPGTALGLPGTITPRGLQLPGRLTFEEWEAVGHTLQTLVGSIMFLVGDWYLFGEDHFGELAAQAIGDDTGYSPRTVQQAAWVCGRFPFSRRLESVPFSTHMALAGVEDEVERYALLERAARERWTMREARGRARDLKGTPPAIGQGEGTSVDVGEFMITLFREQGILVVQKRDRRTGIALDRAMFTDDAVDLIMAFLNGSTR